MFQYLNSGASLPLKVCYSDVTNASCSDFSARNSEPGQSGQELSQTRLKPENFQEDYQTPNPGAET